MTTLTDHPFADMLTAGEGVFSRTLKTADWQHHHRRW